MKGKQLDGSHGRMSEPSRQTVVVGKRMSKPYVPYGIKRYRIQDGNYTIISDIPQVPIPMQCLIHVKSQFQEKKSASSLCEMFVSYIAQECDNVTAPYYQFPLYYLSSGRL